MALSRYSRYYGLPIVPFDRTSSLALRITPLPVTYPDSLVHVIIGGETLDQLAERYYGREDLWWRIADGNPGKAPLDWRAGESLMIPPLRIATRTPRP
jgi:tail protein X